MKLKELQLRYYLHSTDDSRAIFYIILSYYMPVAKLDRDLPAIIFLVLAMCVSMELYFTWLLPQSIINFVCAVVVFLYLLKVKVIQQSMSVVILLVLNCVYNYTHNTVSFNILSFLNLCSVIIMMRLMPLG